MKCDVCGNGTARRTIAGISMCEYCFNKLTLLRNNNIEGILFFQNADNLINASEKAKKYFKSILEEKNIDNEQMQIKLKTEKEHLDAIRQVELDKINFAKSFNEYYEYDVITIQNNGSVNTDKLKMILSEYAAKGWKLHSIYSNELGKNAILGLNATACEDVLIFERRVEKI